MQTEIIPVEIDETPEAIRATIEAAHATARDAAESARALSPRRIFVIGNGTSLYSSMAAVYVPRTLGTPEGPDVIAVPAGDFRHFTPQIGKNDVVIGMSASGEFRDVIAVFERLRGRCLRIGITHVPSSTLTRVADHLVFSSGGESNVPVMTKTYASTLTALHLLLLETFGAPAAYFDDLADSAKRCEDALVTMKQLLPSLVPEVKEFEHAFFFGAGSAYAAALEGALKMKEMAILHAEGSETWEMASGPATVVSEESLCVALYTGDRSDESTKETARHAESWGAKVIEIGPEKATGGLHVPVAAPRVPGFSSLSLVPPLALLAYETAKARGHDPNKPAWRERYTSQGMTHILGE